MGVVTSGRTADLLRLVVPSDPALLLRLALPIMLTTMSLHAHLMLLLLLATVLMPLLSTLPLRGWRWDRQCWWLLGLLSFGMPLAMGHRFARILLPGLGALFSA